LFSILTKYHDCKITIRLLKGGHMLYIKTLVKPSCINSVGCFAAEDIPAGTLVWQFNSATDVRVIGESYGLWKQCLAHYGWWDGCSQILCFDNAKYINHSESANLVLDKETGNMHAKHDIKSGDELCENYREVYGSVMEDFSHSVCGHIRNSGAIGLFELDAVCLCSSPDDLRRLASFLCDAADELERGCCNIRLSDWLNKDIASSFSICKKCG